MLYTRSKDDWRNSKRFNGAFDKNNFTEESRERPFQESRRGFGRNYKTHCLSDFNSESLSLNFTNEQR